MPEACSATYNDDVSRSVRQVVWQRNGRDLPVNSRYEMIVTSRLFSLRIADVKDEDFGNYTCLAKNELGQNLHHITLTGAKQGSFCL